MAIRHLKIVFLIDQISSMYETWPKQVPNQVKGGLISESFSLWLKSPKKGAKLLS